MYFYAVNKIADTASWRLTTLEAHATAIRTQSELSLTHPRLLTRISDYILAPNSLKCCSFDKLSTINAAFQ